MWHKGVATPRFAWYDKTKTAKNGGVFMEIKVGNIYYDWRKDLFVEVLEISPAGYPYSAKCFVWAEGEARFGTEQYLGIESDIAGMDMISSVFDKACEKAAMLSKNYTWDAYCELMDFCSDNDIDFYHDEENARIYIGDYGYSIQD